MSRDSRRSPLLAVATVLRDGQEASFDAFVDAVRAWGGEVVQEICVYDTTESHVAGAEVARLGIKATRGYWDRELGRARNEAMGLVESPWVLVLDVDERPIGDVAALQNLLRDAEQDVLLTEVSDDAATQIFGRVLRRGAVTYVASESEFTPSSLTPERSYGRVPAEALEVRRASRGGVGGAGELPRRLSRLLQEAAATRGDDSDRVARTRLRLANEYRVAGHLEQALRELEALSQGDASEATRWASIEARTDLLIGQGRLELAEKALKELEDGPNLDFSAWLRAHWHLRRGEGRLALAKLRTLDTPAPIGGDPVPPESVLRLRFRVAQDVNDSHESLTSLLALMATGEEIVGRGSLLLELWGKRDPKDLAAVIFSTGTVHVDAIADEVQQISSRGAAVARELRQGRDQQSVAAVIIARDEARCIERCIRSVLPWVDEVIVADTGSSDDTPRLAASAGARVIHVPWTDDFAAARNAALNRASADWHVILDADEIIAAGGKELLDLRQLAPEWVLAVNVVSSFRLAGSLEVESEPQSRILPGHVRYTGIVHASPQHNLPVNRVRVTIEHDGYEPDQLADKLPRRERLLRLALATDPSDAYMRYQLGRNLETQGRLVEAVGEYDRMNLSQLPSESWRHVFIVQYAHCLTSIDRSFDALSVLTDFSHEYDGSSDFHFVAGNVLVDLAAANPAMAPELLPRAVAEFRRCLDIGEGATLAGHVTGRGSYLAEMNLEVVTAGCRDLGISLSSEEVAAPSGGGEVLVDASAGGHRKNHGLSSGEPEPLADGSLDVVMIVKNEAARLGRALASCAELRPLLGNICVYDTGSTDGTRELARSYGARVVSGYWDDNYSRARNAAAAMSDAPWLLVIDADEWVLCDPAALAIELARADLREHETLSIKVTVVGPQGDRDSSAEHWMSARLYRPDLARYERPVHAELRRRDGARFTTEHHVAPGIIRLENDGFDAERQRTSVIRALHLTDLAQETRADNDDRHAVYVDRARARWSAGDVDGARADLRAAIEMGSGTNYFQWGFQWLVRLELESGTMGAAAEALDTLKAIAPTDSYTRWLDANLLLARGHASEALQILTGLGSVVDAIGLPLPEELVAEAAVAAARAAQDDAATVRAIHRLAAARGDSALSVRAQRLAAGLRDREDPTVLA